MKVGDLVTRRYWIDGYVAKVYLVLEVREERLICKLLGAGWRPIETYKVINESR